MRFRFTQKDLNENSDLWLVTALCNERMSDLNPYAPLYKRLQALRAKIASGKKLTTCEDAKRIAG